jgi:uncharacterized membrane protein
MLSCIKSKTYSMNMALKNQDEGINAFQTFSTLLALLLPVLQFFFNFLPVSSQNVFVIQRILTPVTIIAGVFSYILIIAFKNVSWFNIPFNLKKHREYLQYQDQINLVKSEPDDAKREASARQLLKNQKRTPFYLSPLNVYYLLIPLLVIFVLVFLSIGIYGSGSSDQLLVLLQSVSYIFAVALTSLTLAVFYINETNRKNQQKLNRDKYQKIIQLLFDNNSLPEFPKIEFVAQNDADFSALQTYVKVNSGMIYQITTDNNGDILKQVLPQPPVDTRHEELRG